MLLVVYSSGGSKGKMIVEVKGSLWDNDANSGSGNRSGRVIFLHVNAYTFAFTFTNSVRIK